MLARCVKNDSCIDNKCLATRQKITRTSEAGQRINFMAYQFDVNVVSCVLLQVSALMV